MECENVYLNVRPGFENIEAVALTCSMTKVFLNISQIHRKTRDGKQENTLTMFQ